VAGGEKRGGGFGGEPTGWKEGRRRMAIRQSTLWGWFHCIASTVSFIEEAEEEQETLTADEVEGPAEDVDERDEGAVGFRYV
jgi:hypothetical protein